MCEDVPIHEPGHGAAAPGRLARRTVLRGGAALGGWLALGGPRLGPAGAAGLGLAEGAAAGAFSPEVAGMGEDPWDAAALVEAAEGSLAAAALRPVQVAPPPILTRAEWGADELLRTTDRGFARIQKLVVHHTATSNDAGDWAEQIRSIYRFHVQGRAYADIAYNFLIDPLGRVWEGRWARDYRAGEVHSGEDRRRYGVIGAHTLNHNTGTCGVALLGTYGDRLPSAAALEALVQVLAWKAGPRGIDPLGADEFRRFDGTVSTFPNIVGHGDLVATSCPGGSMRSWLPELRRRVAARTVPGLIGYRVLSSDGHVASFGGAGDHGTPRGRGVRNAVAITSALDPQGYWVLTADGEVLCFGSAAFHGSLPQLGVRTRAVDIAATPTGDGYWILGSDGGIFSFGDAAFHGSLGGVRLNGPAVKIRPTPSGRGYWMLGSDGGVFCFGDAEFHGSLGGLGVRTPTIDLTPTSTGEGYWLLGADGGVFCFGDARFEGSVPGLGVRWTGPAVSLTAAPEGAGYHVLASDGGVFSFGEVPFFGSAAGSGRRPIGMAPAIQA